MDKKKIQIAIILLLLAFGVFALAQDAGVTPSSPSISICGDGIFTITVDNTGLTPITGVIVNAQVPAEYLYVSATGGPSQAGAPPLVTWDDGGAGYTIPAGGSWSNTITISPGCSATIGSSLDIVVSYNEGVDITTSSGGITTLQPNIIIEITPLVQTQVWGATAEWDVLVKNTGVGDLNDVTITATPEAGLTKIGTVLMTPVNIPVIPAGGSVNLTAVDTVKGRVDSCTDLSMLFSGVYGCGGVDCYTYEVVGGVELEYRTPNLDYNFTTVSAGPDVDIPYCGTDTVTINVTNSGATAGIISDLTFGLVYQPTLGVPQIDITNVTGTGDLIGVTYAANLFDVNGGLPPGGSGTISFDVNWNNLCAPVDCASLIFEPNFLDSCGVLFYPPVKELPVTTAPTEPTLTITKTQISPADVPDEGEAVDYQIDVTLNADAALSTTADVVDTYPPSFAFVSASAGGVDNGTTVTWDNEVFVGGVTRTFTVSLTADYNNTDCSAVIENSAIVENATDLCVGCTVSDVSDATPIIGDGILTVSKSGPNSLHINGAAGTYTISVTYDGPLCDYGSGNETPALTVTDTFPTDSPSIPVLTTPAPPPGVSVVIGPPDGKTITWTIAAGTLTKDVPFTLNYDAQMIPSPGPIDPCDCGNVITNSVTATLDAAACITCEDTATLAIGIECDDELTSPVDINKTSDVTSQELCSCITYTNTITFNDNSLTWADLEFTENGNNSQLFTGGANSGTALFTFSGTGEALTGTITLGSPFDLNTLGFSANPSTGDTLTIEYTICLISTSTLGNFMSWSDLTVDGYDNPCLTDDALHEGTWITSIERPSNISIAEFCHYVNAECSFIITKCEESTFQLNIDRTNPTYDVIMVVELLDNYTFILGSSVFTNLPVVAPVYDPVASTVTWDFGDIGPPAFPVSDSGILVFDVYKDCDDENEIRANISFQDNCDTATSVVDTYDAVRTWGGDLITKKTPEKIYIKDRVDLPTWTLYITNRGSGVAYNVNVVDSLETGLEYVSYTLTGLSAGPPPATETFTPPPAGPGGDMSWLISYIPPGETVEIELTAEVVDCANRNNSLEAHWGCGPVAGACFDNCCQDIAPTGATVDELTSKIAIIEHSSDPIDFCEDDSTVVIRFQNIGDTDIYDMVVTEVLPISFEYVAGTSNVDCAGGGDCTSSFNYNAGTRTLTWEFDYAISGVAIEPNEVFTITFDVEPGDSPICDYNNGDQINLSLLYRPPCGGAGDTATNSLTTVGADPEITVVKTPDTILGEPGDSLIWTFTLDNTGDFIAREIKLWDTLPVSVSGPLTIVPVGATPAVTLGTGTVGDPWIVPDMASGATFVYTVTGTVNANCEDDLLNTANVVWGCCDLENSDDSSIVDTAPVVIMDNSLSVGSAVTNCGATLEITIENDSGAAYLTAATTDLTFEMPSGYIHDILVNTVATSSDGGRVFPAPPNPTSGAGTAIINWDHNFFGGVINAGEIITFTFDIVPGGIGIDCTNAPGGNSTVTFNYDDNSLCTTVPPTYTSTESISITPSYPEFNITKTPALQIIPSGGSASWDIYVEETAGEVADGTIEIVDTLGSDYNMGTVVAPNITDPTGFTAVPVIAGSTITWSGLSFNGNDSIGPFTITATPGAGAMEANLTNDVVVGGTCDDGCVFASVSAPTVYVGYSGISKDIVETTATIGEEINIAIDTNYFGVSTNYTNIIIVDTLPAGMSYVAGSANIAPTSVIGQLITWGPYNPPPGPQAYNITFRAVIDDVAANNDGDTKTNSVTHWYTIGTDNFTESDTDSVDIIESFLEITKDEDDPDDIVSAGDTLTYTISVDHTALSNADAFDVTVEDTIPAGLTYVPGSLTLAGTAGSVPLVATYTAPDTISFTATTIPLLPAGSYAEIEYQVTVDTGVEPNEVLTNNSHLEWTSLTGTPTEERNGTGSSGGDAWDDYFDDTSDTVTVTNTHDIIKTLVSASPVTIGSGVDYRIEVELPDATIPSLTITDVMGLAGGGTQFGLKYETGTAVYYVPGSAAPVALEPTIAPVANDGTAPVTLEWDFGSFDATGATVARPYLVIEFSAIVANVDENNNGDALPNSATLDYVDNLGNPQTDSDSSAVVDVDEPFLSITKSHVTVPGGDPIEAGTVIEYTIEVENTGTSTAYDVVVTDTIPAGLTYNAGTISGTGNDDSGAPNLRWDIPSIAVGAGSAETLTYRVTVASTVIPAEVLTNTAVVEWQSLTGSPGDERTGSGAPVWNDYTNNVSDSVTVDDTSSITKTLDGAYTEVRIGHRMTYTISVGLPQATIPTLTVNDDMSAGIYYVTGTASVTFPNGTVSAIAPSTIIGPNDGTAATTLLWDDAAIASFNNIDASSGNPLVITFDAIVANEANVQDGLTIDNDADYDYTDFTGANHTGTDSSRSVDVIEADLIVDKSNSTLGIDVEAGDTITYTIRVEHTGSTTSDAYDVSVEDTIPAGLTYVGGTLAATGGSVAVVTDDSGVPVLSFTAVNVPMGSYAEVEYDVTVDAGVIPDETMTNTTHLEWTSWPGIPGAPADERTGTNTPAVNDYFDDTSNTVTVETAAGIAKTPDGGNLDSLIPYEMTYTITIDLPSATIPTLDIRDVMGAGIYYINGNTSITLPDGSTPTTDPAIFAGPNDGTAATTLRWTYNNLDASSGNPLVIVFDAVVSNTMNVQDGLIIGNTASYDFTDFQGDHHTDSDTSRNLRIREADLGVDKSNSTLGADVAAGDTITYTIRVEHTGSTTSDAYDVSVEDTIPAGLTYVGGTLAATGGSVAVVTDDSGVPVLSFTAVNVPMGSYAEVEYDVTVDDGVIPDETMTNTTHLEWTSWPGGPAVGVERTGVDGSGAGNLNNYADDTSNTVTVETGATIDKTPDGAIRDFDIGVATGTLDVVPYTITMTLPRATIPTLVITDVMGEGIYYQNNSATVNFPNGTNQNINPTLTAGSGDGTAASTYEWSGGSLNNVDASSGNPITITFNAVVADVGENDDLDLIPNSASYTYTGFAGFTESGSDSATDIRIHAPAFETEKNIVNIIDKNGNPRGVLTFAEPGDTITYTYSVENIGSGIASSVVITDTMPAEITYVPGSSVYSFGASAEPAGANPYTWNIPDIPGTTTFTLTFDAVVTTNVLNANLYDNVASVTGVDDLGNTIPTDNSIHIPAGDTDIDDSDNAVFTARVPALTVDKEVVDINGVAFGPGNNSIQPGDYVTYRLRVNNVGTGTAYEIRAIDTLPVGIVYGSGTPAPSLLGPGIYSNATWDATSSTSHPTITTPGGAGVSEVIEWYLPTFDVTLAPADTLEITYRVYVNSDIIEGLPAINYVTGAGLDGSDTPINTDRSADVPADTDATDDASTTIFTDEPFLVTEKLVTAIDGNAGNTTVAVHGSVIDYSYTIENVGLGDAIDVNITDTMPLGFEYVLGSANIGDPTTIVGRDLIWLNNYTILPGNTLTITFQLLVTSAAPGGARVNTAVTDGNDRNLQPIIRDGSAITPLDTDNDDADTAEVFIPVNSIKLTKDSNPRSVNRGGIVRYTVTFYNNRKSSLFNATLTDTMPSGFKYIPGTSLLDGVGLADPSGSNPYKWNLGTIAAESTVVLKYHALVTHSAKTGININRVVLNVKDGSGKSENLTADSPVSVKGKKLKPFSILPPVGDVPVDTGEIGKEKQGKEEEEKKEKKPACCLGVRKIAIRSQDFKNTLPGYPEIYYQTDIAMYGATELFMVKDYLSPLLILKGIDPEEKYFMTGLYNRVIEKLGEYAQYNLGNVVMKSELGIPFIYSPTMIEKIKETGKDPSDILDEYLLEMAKDAGLDEVPDIDPIFLEFFGSYPYLEDKISDGKLAWKEEFMDKNIMPAALGFTLLRASFQIDQFLKSDDPTDRFFGMLLLAQSMEKMKSAFEDLAVTAEFSPPVTYFPHYSTIEIDKNTPALKYKVVDETSTLYDHAAMLWGLSKLRSVLIHSQDPKVRENIETIDKRMKESYKIIEKIHYNREDKTFLSFHGPSGSGNKDETINTSDLAFTILALRSVYNDNRDLRLNSEDPKRKIVSAADFILEKLVSKKDGGVYTSYDYSTNEPDTGTRRTLLDNSLAIRAFLTAYVITEDVKYKEAAEEVYDWMVEELWKEEYLIFVDEEDYDYEVILTPQSIGALIAAMRELTLYGERDRIYDYLDKMSYTTERILDQSQLQLYENRFFPWHAPLALIPEDPNGRSYIKPIITPVRDKDMTRDRDLAPILVRKMVLNLTPTGAIASGDEPKVFDQNKWRANLRFETPDLIASTKVDDVFETDIGMYFSSLIYDYHKNLKKELPTFNPYLADPDIPHYAAYLSDEVAGFNVKNLTLNSIMGVKLTESDVVIEMAKKKGVTPEEFVKDFVAKRLPDESKSDKSAFKSIMEKFKGVAGIDSKDRFEDIIYLEYAEGKPYYEEKVEDGWIEDEIDTSMYPSSIAQTMIRQIQLIKYLQEKKETEPSDRLVEDTMKLVVVSKHRFLADLTEKMKEDKLDFVPHQFELKWDKEKKRNVPVIKDKKSDLFDQVSLIWAMALWNEMRDEGLFDNYSSYLGDRKVDEELLEFYLKALVDNHYDKNNKTMITGSVDAIEVSMALDILTRIVETVPEGDVKDKIMELIKAQADFIIEKMIDERGVIAIVDNSGKAFNELCEFESIGTHTIPLNALYRAYVVTGDKKYLDTALSVFLKVDKKKWDQQLGLYLSSGTIYENRGKTKVELSYTNLDLIFTIMLIAELQPFMDDEQKILTAYHMVTFMNRILEIGSLERYPGNEDQKDGENEKIEKDIYSPQIIRSVKIVVSESPNDGTPCGVFTFLVIIDNYCVDESEFEVNNSLSRIRVEDTLAEDFHYVPGSTTINGKTATEPVGSKKLNWYISGLRYKGRIVLRYQAVADCEIDSGTYENRLDVKSFLNYNGKVYSCDELGVTEGVRITEELWTDKEEEENAICLPCNLGD